METQEASRFSLWKRRHTLPTIQKRASVTLLLLLIAAAILLPGGAFGVLYLIVAGALLAFLLTADRSLLWLLSIPGVGAMAYLSYTLFAAKDTSVLWVLAAFLYIPVGISLAICIYKRQNLTSTVTALAVVFGVLLLAIAAIQFQIKYGNVRDGFVSIRDQFQDGLVNMLSGIGLPGEDGVTYVYTEKEVQAIAQSAIMLLPAMGILTCQLFAYLTAKIFRLLTLAFGTDFLFEKERWPLTASVPAYIVFVVCYFVSLFTAEASVVGYASFNLLYIFLPVTAVAGFHAMFGNIPGKRRAGGRVALILMCAFLFFLSPIALLILLSFFGAIRTFGSAIRHWMKKRRGPDI